MTLTDSDKVDRLFKGSQGRKMTSTNKAYYEEGAGDLDIQLGEEIWIDDIDSNPATAIANGTVWMQSGWMHEDATVASQKAWFASGSNIGYWTRWIPPKCGQEYTIKIYQSGSGDGNLGNKLSDADMGTLGAVFDYQAGIFWMNTSPTSYTQPFYISGYIYSGNLAKKSDLDKLYQESGTAGTDVAWSGASDFYGFSSNTAVVKNGYATVSDGSTIAHGLSNTPKYANISPSGFSVNFGATCSVDDTNITVYLTAPGSRNVFWTASL